MIKFIHIMILVPFWYWWRLPFIKNFFIQFPYNKRDKHGTWHGEVVLVSSFKSTVKTSFEYTGKFHRAYTKVRIQSLIVDWSYPEDCFGVEYSLSEKILNNIKN